jgi:hypothetical protein
MTFRPSGTGLWIECEEMINMVRNGMGMAAVTLFI